VELVPSWKSRDSVSAGDENRCCQKNYVGGSAKNVFVQSSTQSPKSSSVNLGVGKVEPSTILFGQADLFSSTRAPME